MKKILILSIVALLILTGVSYARIGDSRVGYTYRESAMIFNDENGHVHITTSAADVWRITLFAEATDTYVQLYNSNDTTTYDTMASYLKALIGDRAGNQSHNGHLDVMTTNVKADLCVATAGDASIFNFDPPLHFSKGILAGFIDAVSAPTSQNDVNAVIEWTPAPVE